MGEAATGGDRSRYYAVAEAAFRYHSLRVEQFGEKVQAYQTTLELAILKAEKANLGPLSVPEQHCS